MFYIEAFVYQFSQHEGSPDNNAVLVGFIEFKARFDKQIIIVTAALLGRPEAERQWCVVN